MAKLAEIINYETHLAPYRLIQIVAGVGAGKNYWAGELIKQGYRVLLITSRAATANAQAKKLKISRWIDLDELYEVNENYWGSDNDLKCKNVICTNASIEKFAKHRVTKGNPRTYIWKYFDFIILDEAHSLTTDAVFSEAPFYVEHFLKHCYRQNKKLKIVLMTGTPEPIDWLLPDEEENHQFKCWNFFDECVHLEPKTVILDSSANVLFRMMHQYQRGQRIIYFANTVDRIANLSESLLGMGIPDREIFVSYSKESVQGIPAVLTAKMKNLQGVLEQTEHLPDGVRFFLTTTKNKEGINIEDNDVKVMFAESHERCELVQMAGRVRNGLDRFCIVYDAVQHSLLPYQRSALLDASMSEQFYASFSGNENEIINEYGQNEVRKYIENRFNCIRFNVFENRHRYYTGRMQGLKKALNDSRCFSKYVNEWRTRRFLSDSSDPSVSMILSGKDMLQRWFPYSKLCLCAVQEDVVFHVKSEIDAYLRDNELVDTPITIVQRNNTLAAVNSILRPWKRQLKMSKEYTTLGNALGKYSSYRIDKYGANDNSKFKITLKDNQ